MIRRTLNTITLAGSLALCVLLLYVGWQKAADPASLRDAMLAHRIVPESMIGIVTKTLPWAEIASGFLALTLLLSVQSRRSGAALLALVFGSLAAYVTLIWINPPAKPAGCGCGLSAAPVTDWFPLVARNTTMAAIPVILALCSPRPISDKALSHGIP